MTLIDGTNVEYKIGDLVYIDANWYGTTGKQFGIVVGKIGFSNIVYLQNDMKQIWLDDWELSKGHTYDDG